MTPPLQTVESHRRVLIIEFRDEVYADLRSVFEGQGCEVARANSGASVATHFVRFAPNLALVNESMPDESGWLITNKLRLTRRAPVWLYAVRKPDVDDDWKEYMGVDEILAYGGVVSRLRLRVREQLNRWLPDSAEYCGHRIEADGDNCCSGRVRIAGATPELVRNKKVRRYLDCPTPNRGSNLRLG